MATAETQDIAPEQARRIEITDDAEVPLGYIALSLPYYAGLLRQEVRVVCC